MPKLSRDRVNQLARVLVDEMTRARTVNLLKDRDAVRQSIVHALGDELKHEEEREHRVRLRILAMKKPPMAPSREYDTLFRQLMEEEYAHDGLTI
jgi:hypothetical protein